MEERLKTTGYLAGVEELRRRELIWGYVREPPAPRYGHQAVVTRTTVLLDAHVRAGCLGIVCVSPIDVVLDEAAALILQPDVIFVSNRRASIVRDQVWGAPDLVVEVMSPRTAMHDSTTKLAWYRRYGVRECWLVDPVRWTIRAINLEAADDEREFAGEARMQSWVLPGFSATARDFFE